jgi:hypothetical protein
MDREPLPQHYDAMWEAFKNDTSEEIPAHGVIAISGRTLVNNRQVLLGAKPSTYGSRHAHRLNGPIPVAAGAYGICRIYGVCTAVYETTDGTPAIGDLWGPRDGGWKLRSATPGWRIIGGAENGLIFVVHEPSQTLVGKTDAAINKAASGTVSIYWSVSGGAVTDTNVNVTAYNRFGNVASSKFVKLDWNGWGWDIIAAECG